MRTHALGEGKVECPVEGCFFMSYMRRDNFRSHFFKGKKHANLTDEMRESLLSQLFPRRRKGPMPGYKKESFEQEEQEEQDESSRDEVKNEPESFHRYGAITMIQYQIPHFQ